MIYIGHHRECFFDNYLIDEKKTTAEARLHHPVPREVVLNCDKPWETRGLTYENFFFDSQLKKYRMYYLAREALTDLVMGEKIRVAYAESEDGCRWMKPSLGLFEYKGSKDNNIVFDREAEIDNFFVFYDENPTCLPEERYKALVYTETKDKRQTLRYYASADGFSFNDMYELPLFGAFDSLNTALWDKNTEKYYVYYRTYHNKNTPEIVQDRVLAPEDIRDIRVATSENFRDFCVHGCINFGEESDIPLYTNCVSSYPFAPHIFVGFPSRYVNRGTWSVSYEALCTKEGRLKRIKENARLGLALTDCIFMTSRDGVNFKRYNEAFMTPGAEYDGNWIYGDCYPARGFILTDPEKNGEDVDQELSLLCHDREKYGGNLRLRRYTIRRDGFVSLHAGEEEKLLVTKPFVFEGEKLTVNLSTSAFGYAVFKLETADGKLCTESVEYFGDSTDKPIAFRDPTVLFSGKEVVMTVRLRDADIYSFRFA